MSKKYKFGYNDKLHFVTFSVTNWIDLFIRTEYKTILLDSIKFCQQNKDLEVYAYCVMTSHVHLIIGSKGKALSDIMRDLKRHSSEMLHKAIAQHPNESRKEWMLEQMGKAALQFSNNSNFQLWQPESHPIELNNDEILKQKCDYIHYNPVEAGFVRLPEEWLYSSAGDYNNTSKGLLDIILLEPVVI